MSDNYQYSQPEPESVSPGCYVDFAVKDHRGVVVGLILKEIEAISMFFGINNDKADISVARDYYTRGLQRAIDIIKEYEKGETTQQ